MPLPLDLCRLSSTVANGVQVFLQRLFHVVKINGLRVGASEWHEVTVSSLQLDVLFDCSILFFRGRVQAVQELLFFLLLIVFLLYCSTTDRDPTHSHE